MEGSRPGGRELSTHPLLLEDSQSKCPWARASQSRLLAVGTLQPASGPVLPDGPRGPEPWVRSRAQTARRLSQSLPSLGAAPSLPFKSE